MASPGPTDAVLLRDRDSPADTFSQFYRRHARGVLAYYARQNLSAQDAADATADVFVAALAGRYRFSGEAGESAMPWLYTIASNVMMGRHRRSSRERAAHERLRRQRVPLTERDLADYAELRAQARRAMALIDELPAAQRDAVLGRHLADEDYAEIAVRHGVSEQAVRQRVSRALTTVRQQLAAP